MAVYLLLVAVVIFTCVVLNRVSSKLGIPTLLAFILLGMFFGSDGVIKIEFDNYVFAEKICSVALIFIMFYGGFGTYWGEAKPVAVKAVLLSTFGVVFTAGLTGVFCHFVLNLDWLESFLIGSVISSTDAASVFSILRSKRLNLKYNTASLLEVESGSNDPFSYMLTAVFISAIQGSADGKMVVTMILSQIFFGILFGVTIAIISIWLLKRIKVATAGFDMIFVFGIAITAYAAPTLIGGNGYLSVYIVGIILGNIDFETKKNMVHFFDGITGLMQMLIFFLLGLLSFPSKFPEVAITALLIALFITFVARPIAVFLILMPFKSKISQQLMVAWSGLRGAASIVFAIMAVMEIETENDIFHIVFFIVLFSILLQGSLIPLVAKKLNMIDKNADVMKTFNDYSDEVPVQFIQFTIPKGHKWCEREIANITLPPESLVVLVKRNEENIIPNGQTVLYEGDKLILTAGTPETVEGVRLIEKHVTENSRKAGKSISEISMPENTLIIMVQRSNELIIPNGDVVIEVDDVLVISKIEN